MESLSIPERWGFCSLSCLCNRVQVLCPLWAPPPWQGEGTWPRVLGQECARQFSPSLLGWFTRPEGSPWKSIWSPGVDATLAKLWGGSHTKTEGTWESPQMPVELGLWGTQWQARRVHIMVRHLFVWPSSVLPSVSNPSISLWETTLPAYQCPLPSGRSNLAIPSYPVGSSCPLSQPWGFCWDSEKRRLLFAELVELVRYKLGAAGSQLACQQKEYWA